MEKNDRNRLKDALSVAYGTNPPIQIVGRLDDELETIDNVGYLEDLALVKALREAAVSESCEVDARLTFGSGLINWLRDATDVNPLPPHYFCPRCRRIEFVPEAKDCFDLLVKLCCDAPMLLRGHRIPFDSAKGSFRSNGTELQIRIPRSFAPTAADLIREYHEASGGYRVIRSGSDEGRDAWTFALIPQSEPKPEQDENEIKTISLVFSDKKEQLKQNRELTGRRPKTRNLLCTPVFLKVKGRLEKRICEQDKPLLRLEVLSFSSLLAMLGYSQSTYTDDNPVLSAPDARYSDLFTCREEVWEMVTAATKPEYEIRAGFVSKVTKNTRSGRYACGRMDKETERLLHEMGVPEHGIEQMKHTLYLPPKADLVQVLTDELQLAWYDQNT